MSKTINTRPFRETTPEEEKQRHEWRKRKRQIEQLLDRTMWDDDYEQAQTNETPPHILD